MQKIDLRSDTVTKPTPTMLRCMFEAEVGDDVYGEDTATNALQTYAAHLFGKEDALFCPSGTMTNQIAVRVLTEPQDEIITHQFSHVYNYEGGGLAANSLVSARLTRGDFGYISPQDIVDNINAEDVHFAHTKLVSLENTINKGGGCYYTLPQIEAIYDVCRANNLLLHLDGARLFNALVETQESPQAHGSYFDMISICLSKGLGAPVGSLLLGSKQHIAKARRVRKMWGGGMRQTGYLAAAGLYALQNHVERLKEDHKRASLLAQTLSEVSWVQSVFPCPTNIVIFELEKGLSSTEMVVQFRQKGLFANTFGKDKIRFVTHLDFDDDALTEAIKIVKSF